MELNKLTRYAERLLFSLRVERGEDRPNEIYHKLMSLTTKQPELFSKFSGEDLLKLTILMYSLNMDGSFEKAEEIFSKMKYLCLLTTENDPLRVECYECSGNGYELCDECDGDGRTECRECDGEGMVTCSDCDGDKKISCDTCDGTGEDEEGNTCDECGGQGEFTCSNCGGEGQTECDNCDGRGETYCDRCGGDGNINCSYCDGNGEIESDEKVTFKRFSCVSWNEDLNNSCELFEGEENAVLDEDTSLLSTNGVIILNQDEEDGVPEFNLSEGELYCFFYGSNTKLSRGYERIIIDQEDQYQNYFD